MSSLRPLVFLAATSLASLSACGLGAPSAASARLPFRAPLDVSRAASVVDQDVFIDTTRLVDFDVEFVEDAPGSGSRRALAAFLGSGATLRVAADSIDTGHPQALETRTAEELAFLRAGGLLIGDEPASLPEGSQRSVTFVRNGVVEKTRVYRVPPWRLAYAPGGAGTPIALRLAVTSRDGPPPQPDGLITTHGATGTLRAVAHLPLQRGTVHVHIETTTAQPVPPGWHSNLLITWNPKIEPAR